MNKPVHAHANGKCPICGKPYPCLDHNTGR